MTYFPYRTLIIASAFIVVLGMAPDAYATTHGGTLFPVDERGGTLTPPDERGGSLTPVDERGGSLTPVDERGGSLTAPGGGGTLVNPLKVDNLRDLLNIVLEAVVDIGTIILVLALVWVGFLFVAARGNEEKLRNARAALFWTVIGGLILLGAQAIALVIEQTATNLGS